MARFVFTRALGALAAIVGASVLAFVFLRITPGNPARLILGQFATQAAISALIHQLGLHQPIYVQYAKYIWSFLHGSWGYSYSVGEPVRTLLGQRLPATIELGLYAFLFALVGALVLALISTYRRRRAVEGAVEGIAILGLGIPQFWLGLVLLLLLFEHAGLFPGPEGRLSPNLTPPPHLTGLYTVDALLSGKFGTLVNALWHLALPAVTLGLAPMAFLTRLLRANLLEVSREPFILVAQSTGLSRWRAFLRHALPNAILPTVTASGLVLGQLLAGSVLVETVFRWPGVGALVTQGVQEQDYSVVQAFILLSATAYVLVNLGADIVVAMIDPRVRVEGQAS
jgi:ABC-type dipeptide/oligopeptide/nickel transport system permease component